MLDRIMQGLMLGITLPVFVDVNHCAPLPLQAEELNTIIGNAFKMAYAAQREKQPTFHELIEAQVAEQQAAFRESQEAAKRALQAKLTEIATPTPFSDKARTRMELRRSTNADGDEGLSATLTRFRATHAVEPADQEKDGEGGARRSKVWVSMTDLFLLHVVYLCCLLLSF